MLRLLNECRENASLHKSVWSASSLEGRRQINVSGNDATIQQREHTVLNVILGNRRRVRKWIVTELLWQDSLWFVGFTRLPLAYAKFFEF